MMLEAYVIIGYLVIFLTENNIPKSMNTDPHLKKSYVVFHKVRFSVQFLIYINDISNSTEVNLLSFADDTTIYCSETTLDENCKKKPSEHTKILYWLHSNRLSLSINKTNFTIFGPQCSANETTQAAQYV